MFSAGRAISTSIEKPLGPCHGVIVFVPPCAHELDVAYRTLRVLAHRAALAGFVSCLPDLSGHGDSSPIEGYSDLKQVWVDDIHAIVDEANQHAPGIPVHLVGLRLGAAIASLVDRSVASRTLWEPVDGRRFVLSQRLLAKLAFPDASDQEDLVDLPGLSMTADQAGAMRRIRSQGGNQQQHEVVRLEKSRTVAKHIYDVRPGEARVPFTSVDEIISSLPASTEQGVINWPSVSLANMDVESRPIQEVHRTISPHRLQAVETRPLNGSTTQGVLFTAIGAELRSGSGSVWSELARRAASRGIIALRSDRRLIGDMIDYDADEAPWAYSDQAVEDVAHGVQALHAQGVRDVTVVGVCSGAWLAMKASNLVPIHKVIAINSLLWNTRTSTCRDSLLPPFLARSGDVSPSTGSELMETPGSSPSLNGRRIARSDQLSNRLRAISERYPGLRGAALATRSLGLGAPIIGQVPNQTQLKIVLGEMEWSAFQLIGGMFRVALARRAGKRVDVHCEPTLEHALLTKRSREFVIETVLSELEKG